MVCRYAAYARRWIRIGLALGVAAILVAGSAPPAPGSAETDALAASLQKELTAIKSAMVNMRHDEAQAAMPRAEEMLKRLQREDPGHRQLKTLQSRYDGYKAELDKKAAKQAAPPPPAAAPEPAKPRFGLPKIEVPKIDIGKPDLPKVRVPGLESMAPAGDATQPAAGGAAAMGAGQPPAKATAGEQPWIERLKVYVVPVYNGGDEKKYLIPSATMERAEMQKRLGIYAEASAAMAEYRKSGPQGAKSEELTDVETKLSEALDQFKQSCAEYAKNTIEEVSQQMEQQSQWLKTQEEKKAKNDPQNPPLPMQKDILQGYAAKIEDASIFVEKDDPRIAALKSTLEDLRTRDAAIRQARVDQTRMRSGKYAGADLVELKAKAEAIVKEKIADARILRIEIVSEDWTEESAIEWTDTTRTALRSRTTRSVTAEVAAMRDGQCSLYTLDISKDRRTDGTWGALTGHIMFTDPILEKNVGSGS